MSSLQSSQRSLVAFFHSGLDSAFLTLGQPEHSLASFFKMGWTGYVKRILAFIHRITAVNNFGMGIHPQVKTGSNLINSKES